MFVDKNNSFAIFDGVQAGKLSTPDTDCDDDVSVQQNARGGFLVHKNLNNKFETFAFNDLYHLRVNDDEEEDDLFVVGFTAHEKLRNSCIVHVWNATKKTFMRSSGIDIIKHIKSGASQFWLASASRKTSSTFLSGFT